MCIRDRHDLDAVIDGLMTNDAEAYWAGPKTGTRWVVSDRRDSSWLFSAEWTGDRGQPFGQSYRADALLYRIFTRVARACVDRLSKVRGDEAEHVDPHEILALTDPGWSSEKGARRRHFTIGLRL